MELREILEIFLARRRVLFWTLGFFLVGGLLFWEMQPISYRADITMNVARSGMRETNDYSYDSFYRLQADERFADTVVRWLESPRILSDINREAGENLASQISAERLSSQVIRVQFRVSERNIVDPITQSLFRVLNHEAKSLNTGPDPAGWFVLVGDVPVVSDARFSFVRTFLFSGALGMFFGILSLLLSWYFSGGGLIRSGRDRQNT